MWHCLKIKKRRSGFYVASDCFWVSSRMKSTHWALGLLGSLQNGWKRRADRWCFSHDFWGTLPLPPFLRVGLRETPGTLVSPIHQSIHPYVCPAGPPPPPPSPPSGPSGPQQLLDKVSRHAVEEEAQHDEQQQGQHDLDDQPLVAVAHQVTDGFQRAQEPQEGGVWATRGRDGWGQRAGGWRGEPMRWC